MSLQDFDARTVQPSQGGTAHPVGMHDFQITNTYLKETQDKNGLMLIVEMTSPVGVIENRYNIVNQSKQAEEISQKQLSALCHAINIYRCSYPKDNNGMPLFDQAARELRGGRGRMEIAPQMRKNEKGELVPNGYVEVKKVYDSQGNEPGKTGTAAQPMQQGNHQPNAAQGQPMQGQPQVQNGWGNQPQQQPQQSQPQPPAQNPGQAGGWQQPQQNNAPAGNSGAPPWAQRG